MADVQHQQQKEQLQQQHSEQQQQQLQQQRRQSISTGSLPVDTARRGPTSHETSGTGARAKTASSYTLPYPPDARRRGSRDLLSRSLGAQDYRYHQQAVLMREEEPPGIPVATRAGHIAAGQYQRSARDYPARKHVPQDYQRKEYPGVYYYATKQSYVPEHPYGATPMPYTADPYLMAGAYDWKEAPTTHKMRPPALTQVGMMYQAGDVAAQMPPKLAPPAPQEKTDAPATMESQEASTDDHPPVSSEWSPTKELMKEDSRSVLYYAGPSSEVSSDARANREHSSDGSTSGSTTSSSSESTESSAHSDQAPQEDELKEQELQQQQIMMQHHQLQQKQLQQQMVQQQQLQQQQLHQQQMHQQQMQQQQIQQLQQQQLEQQQQFQQQQAVKQQVIQQQKMRQQQLQHEQLQKQQLQQHEFHQQQQMQLIHQQLQQQAMSQHPQTQRQPSQHQHQVANQQQQQQQQQQLENQQATESQAQRTQQRVTNPPVRSVGRVATSGPPPPAGPPPAYYARPSISRQSSLKGSTTSNRSYFSVASLTAPLLPARGARLANRSAVENGCILINVVLLSILSGVVSAVLVRQLT